MTVGAGAATVHAPEVGRRGSVRDAMGWEDGSAHTTPDTWATTLTRTPVGTWLCAHDVSKPTTIVAKWNAERIGPRTIGAPHRGQCQAGVVEDGSTRGEERRSNRRASARRGVRHALARYPNCRIRTKPRGRTCCDEAPEKLHGGQRHRAPLIPVRVILPLKGHTLTVEGDQSMVADRDAMRVAPQIPQHRWRPTEGRFRIDDPVGLEERIDEGVPLRRIAEALGRAGEVQVATPVGATEGSDKFPAKHPTEDLDREEEARVLRPNPILMIGRQTAGGYDTVHVGMADECLPPRVEDAEDADLCTEVARVGGDLTQRGRTRLEEPGVELCGVAIAERQQRMRQREDDMHVRHVEELALPGREPPGTRLRLALRTVPIPTRVVRDGPMSAGAALIDMPAERGGPTSG